MENEINIDYLVDESYNDIAPQRTFVNSSQRTNYYTGQGEVPLYVREGALDFKNLPSRGQK